MIISLTDLINERYIGHSRNSRTLPDVSYFPKSAMLDHFGNEFVVGFTFSNCPFMPANYN